MTPLYAGIGGVVRELTEMYTGIGGVVKPMTEMWAGIGGVNRQIFSTGVTITITGKGGEGVLGKCYIEIDGVVYTEAQTLIVPKGTEIYAYTFVQDGNESDGIFLNGERVGASTSTYVSYTFIADSNVSIDLHTRAQGLLMVGTITITTL